MKQLKQLTGKRGDLLALFAGLLLPFSFAPFYLYPLAIISLATLFLLWLHLPPRQAFRRGWFFGLGMFGFGISWGYVSARYFGGASVALAGSLLALTVALFALYPALLGYLAMHLLRWYRGCEEKYLFIELLILLPALWGLMEWIRGWMFTGFPWLNPGYSQVTGPLSGYAPLLGVYGVNWLVATMAGLLALLFLHWKTPRRIQYLLALIVIPVSGLALHQLSWTDPLGSPLKVSLVQGNIPQDQKWQPGQLQNTLAVYTELTADNWDSDLVVWPEAAISTWYHNVETGFLRGLEQQARATNTDMLIGIPYYDFTNKTKYNSVVSLSDGQRNFYHKQHLLPFGDYLPFEHSLRGLIQFFDLPMSSFTPGGALQAPLSVNGHSVSVSICYEDVFGEEIIRTLPVASMLVNVSNDSWWGDTIGPHQHMQIAAMRALETGRPLLRATNNGVTAVADFKGNITYSLPQFTTAVLNAEVQPRRGSTPYVVLGNTLAVLLMSLSLIAVLIWRKRMLKGKH